MSFMDKVKFWKKDDDFSFDSSDSFGSSFDPLGSSSGSDPFALPPDTSSSGLPPNPFSSNESQDPLASDSEFSTYANDSRFGEPSASQSSQSFGSSTAPPPPASQESSRDPFARPVPPPNSQASVGKSLAHNYIQQQSGTAPSPSQQSSSAKFQAGSETEMISLKLDAIRSELNAVSQRLMRLEHLVEEQNKRRGW